MKHWPYLLGGCSLAVAGSVLSVAGLTPYTVPFLRLLFCLGLVGSLISAIALCLCKHWLPSALVGALATSLLALSFGEWYDEHWVPGPTGYTTHLHTLWDLGHVH